MRVLVIVIIAFFLIIVFAFYLNRWLRCYINPCVYPDNNWYRHHLERNFEYVVLGNGIDRWNYANLCLGGGKYFNLALRDQSLERDYYVLRHHFSILKPSGLAIFPLDCSDYYCNFDVKDKRPYIYCNYGYTLSIKRYAQLFKKVMKYYPVLMVQPKDMYALVRHYIKGDEQYFSDVHNIRKIIPKSRSNADFSRIIVKILEFCMLRDIVPLFVINPMSSYCKNDLTDSAALNMMNFLQKQKCFFLDLYNDSFDDSMFEQDGLRLSIHGKKLLTSKLEMARNRINIVELRRSNDI